MRVSQPGRSWQWSWSRRHAGTGGHRESGNGRRHSSPARFVCGRKGRQALSRVAGPCSDSLFPVRHGSFECRAQGYHSYRPRDSIQCCGKSESPGRDAWQGFGSYSPRSSPRPWQSRHIPEPSQARQRASFLIFSFPVLIVRSPLPPQLAQRPEPLQNGQTVVACIGAPPEAEGNLVTS